MPRHGLAAIAAILLVLSPPRPITAQSPHPPAARDQSAAELWRLVDGLTVTPRVLVVGMHPEDEDTRLLSWLSRARHVETAYLSITRGESGLNFGGTESGASLGAIRTEEVLAARRIDGAEQYFTRAFDFGPARTTQDVFDRWDRDSIVGDIVAVMRSFRPHVLIAMLPDSVRRDDGQHQALENLIIQSVSAAGDSTRFRGFGNAWPVSKLYQPGRGISIETAGFDRALGKTFAQLSLESRAQHRSQGLSKLTDTVSTIVTLQRMILRTADRSMPDTSLFSGVDTSFARLGAGPVPELESMISSIAAYADSARGELDPIHPASAVPYLAQVARLSADIRATAPRCRHPSATYPVTLGHSKNCDVAALDLDASVDLVLERSVAALLAAAGVSIEATADRELVAESDTATVTITLSNHGTSMVTLTDLNVWGSIESSLEPIGVPPDSAVHVTAHVAGSAIGETHPWWSGPRGGEKRGGERFAGVPSTLDGLVRGGLLPEPLATLGVAVPENIRRMSDVTVSLQVAGAAVSTSVGAPMFKYADALVGLQHRQMAAVPDVTLQFARGLEWVPRRKPLTRSLHVAVKSHLDREQELSLAIVTPQGMPAGMRVDSLPKTLHLGPREQRDLLVQLRGTVTETDRVALGLIARPSGSAPGYSSGYKSGLQLIQREYLPPIRVMPASGEWMQPIDIAVPSRLTTLYVPGGVDDIAPALRQVGTWVTSIESADQLLTVDLTRVSTMLIGVRAFDIHPDLAGQSARLLDFVRKGGTLVVLRGGEATRTSNILPYPINFASPVGRVLRADAPVRSIKASRLLTWPNRITDSDWADWVSGRADMMPASADARYEALIETHDPGEPENSATVLSARLGKGVFIYTSLTLEQQIAGGVPGALRLLVNLLSAGLSSDGGPAGR